MTKEPKIWRMKCPNCNKNVVKFRDNKKAKALLRLKKKAANECVYAGCKKKKSKTLMCNQHRITTNKRRHDQRRKKKTSKK